MRVVTRSGSSWAMGLVLLACASSRHERVAEPTAAVLPAFAEPASTPADTSSWLTSEEASALRPSVELVPDACVGLHHEVPSIHACAQEGGRFRSDRVDSDLIRLTRLSDGARIWIHIRMETLIIQADDGAFTRAFHMYSQFGDDYTEPSCTVRRGHPILGSSVTSLASERADLLRPGLVEAFFSGEPLPAAEQ